MVAKDPGSSANRTSAVKPFYLGDLDIASWLWQQPMAEDNGGYCVERPLTRNVGGAVAKRYSQS